MLNTILILTGMTAMFVIGYLVGRQIWKKKAQPDIYYKGRLDGFRACEGLVIERMVKSEHIDLTKREILDEFII